MRISLWREDAVAAASLVIAVAAFNFGDEANDAEVTARIEHEAAQAKADIRPQDYVALTMPIGCGQWIAKRGANEHWRVYQVCADATRERE